MNEDHLALLDAVLAELRDHPGCTSDELLAHLVARGTIASVSAPSHLLTLEELLDELRLRGLADFIITGYGGRRYGLTVVGCNHVEGLR